MTDELAVNPDPSTMPVAEKRCDACLFSSARLVDQERADGIVERCEADGRAFICHRFSIVGEYGICRAFFDRDGSLVVRLAKQLGRVRFVPLPPKP